MKRIAGVVLFLVCGAAVADCKHGLPTRGAESLPSCDPKVQVCLAPAVDAIRAKRDARLLRFVGVAWDVYGLCPGNALAAYEEVAALGDAIAAYNAALLHMEPGSKIDLARAAALLEQASKAGDIAARAKLAQMRPRVR